MEINWSISNPIIIICANFYPRNLKSSRLCHNPNWPWHTKHQFNPIKISLLVWHCTSNFFTCYEISRTTEVFKDSAASFIANPLPWQGCTGDRWKWKYSSQSALQVVCKQLNFSLIFSATKHVEGRKISEKIRHTSFWHFWILSCCLHSSL